MAFSVKRAKMAPDCEYPILLNQTVASFPAFCSALLSANIISSSNFFGCTFFLEEKIFLPPGSCFCIPFLTVTFFLLVYLISVQGFFADERVGFSFTNCA